MPATFEHVNYSCEKAKQMAETEDVGQQSTCHMSCRKQKLLTILQIFFRDLSAKELCTRLLRDAVAFQQLQLHVLQLPYQLDSELGPKKRR